MPAILQTLLNDPCGGGEAAAVLLFIGNVAVEGKPQCRRIGAALGGIALLWTLFVGLKDRCPVPPLTLVSLCWGGVTVGTAWILLPIIGAPVQWLVAAMRLSRERKRIAAERHASEQKEQERREAEDRHREEMARLAAQRHQSDPPATAQERLAQAKQCYDERLRTLEMAGLDDTELHAARARAKQQYLHDIEQVMR